MSIIIDKIKLKSADNRAAFEQWVTDTDYLACHDLASVERFVVSKVTDSNCDYDYVEVVKVTSLAAFEQDMQTPLFQSLVARFSELADVVETIKSDTLAPGYQW
ncbi:RedY protein [Pseudoalteromonas sp. S16_S37]|uniref:RedY protein n=1 Tax=Pseudoalteromonas sp. S16_S37 TaxID=2720228 RepID=UPI001680D395|nr:RedY protein [Pseudoalteromonas sp. S16_S37]MBD1582841.1 RedY protein [Pseudoalteromonas sp. S16_S37]